MCLQVFSWIGKGKASRWLGRPFKEMGCLLGSEAYSGEWPIRRKLMALPMRFI